MTDAVDALIRARAILADPQHQRDNTLLDAAHVVLTLDTDPKQLADATEWIERLTPPEATNVSNV